jgi:hypothetical protein
MSCAGPLSFETLVAYWAGDLDDAETDRVDEHLMTCASCSASSERLASLVSALRGLIPPVVDRATVDKLRASGRRLREQTFLPDQRQALTFPADHDLLIHRLTGFDLAGAERVDVTVTSESSGAIIAELRGAPFDPAEGVLIACQQHFAELPTDTVFAVRATSASGVERVATYTILHDFEAR